MNKSVIVYGPQGCGKTRCKERLMKHFGVDRVVDDWIGQRQPYERAAFDPINTLYLTNLTAAEIGLMVGRSEPRRVYSFAEVAQQINAAIPITDWADSPPPAVGEWIASIDGCDETVRRWWDGSRWSYVENFSRRTATRTSAIKWRGLAEEPLPVGA